MLFSTTAVALGLLPLAFSHPLEKRQNALPTINSPTNEAALQLALFLENLELNLYTGGFLNFTDAEYVAAGFPPGFRENVGVIADVSTCLSSPITVPDAYNYNSMRRPMLRPSAQSSPTPAKPPFLPAPTNSPIRTPSPSST